MTSKKRQDMPREYIIAELQMRKLSLSSLGKSHGLSRHTLKNALDKPYPKAEKIIAKALEMTPEEIWPSRYESFSGAA
ncbi:helix-turn-helix domain-containing protein [Vibrio mediterranei]